MSDVLENSHRKRLHEVIVQNPGITFSQALREAMVPPGSGRHHVSKLVAADLILEHRLRSTIRLFANSARFHSGWHGLAALRDQGLRELHDWLAANPASSQSTVVQAFRARGWSRSTTQCRIERLVRDGLASFRFRGRNKVYTLENATHNDSDKPEIDQVHKLTGLLEPRPEPGLLRRLADSPIQSRDPGGVNPIGVRPLGLAAMQVRTPGLYELSP